MTQTKSTTRNKKPQYGKKKARILASDCCEVGLGGLDLSKPFNTGQGNNTNTYVKPIDLYQEPTQHSLNLSTEQYVPFLTNSNNLLDEITSIINTSPTMRGIISKKVKMCLGDGFLVFAGLKKSMLATRKLTPAELSEAQEDALDDYLCNVNPEGETMLELESKVFYDFLAYGNAFIEVIKADIDGEKALVLRHVEVAMCRPRKVDKTRVVTHIGVSDRWTEGEIDPQDLHQLPVFPNFELVEVNDKKTERSIIHIKEYAPGFFYWGVPSWIAAALWGEMEYRIPKYNQSKFVNGYIPSAIVKFHGQMSQKEANEFIKKFLAKFTNTGNNSKIFAYVTADDETKQSVEVLDDKSEGNYMELSKLATQHIIVANEFTSSLAGVETAGKLGSSQQFRTEWEFVTNTAIKPVQRTILSQFINPVIQLANEFISGGWGEVSLGIKNSIPISFVSDLEAKDVLTLDEQREELGREPLETEEVVQSEEEQAIEEDENEEEVTV